jgi:hypothetical protein
MGRTWSPLARTMRVTDCRAKRSAILAAVASMPWVHQPSAPDALDNPLCRHLGLALLRQRGAGLAQASTVALGDGRRLIGLRDTAGDLHYLLDAGTEAIHVLTESAATATESAAAGTRGGNHHVR